MSKTLSTRLKFQYRFHSSHLLWVMLFAVSLLIMTLDQISLWRFDRQLVTEGHYWLFISGHVTHLNWSHWLLNMAGLAIVSFFFSRHASFWEWLCVILLSIFIINIGLWWWLPDIRTYVGLSGVLHGLFLYGALREIKFFPLSGYVLSTVLIAKLLWEAFYGALPGSEDMAGGRVLTEAHLLGATGGVLFWMVSAGVSQGVSLLRGK